MSRCWIPFFAVLLILLLPVTAWAHTGGTDWQGGHWDHSDGTYHFHHGYSAHLHVDRNGDGLPDCPYDFVDNTGDSSGGLGGGGFGETVSLSYSEGYNKGLAEGYKEGYTDGYDAGQSTGFDEGKKEGYNKGQADMQTQLEKEYNDKLEKEKTDAAWLAVIRFVILAGPVLIGICILVVDRKLKAEKQRHAEEMQTLKEEASRSENMAILKRITPGAEDFVELPAGVRLNIACTPVKGRVTKDRPFGDYTVYVSENGTRFHARMGCSYASRPAHLYNCLGQLPLCRSCGKGLRETTVPDWYVRIKTGRAAEKKERSETPKPQSYQPQKHASQNESAAGEPLKETWLSSPVIEKAAYGKGTLYLTFRSGETYAYYNAPESLYHELVGASSAGTVFHQKIKDEYPYTIVKG